MAEKKASTQEVEGGLAITFSSGDVLEAALAQLPDDIVGRLALHGLKQKLNDSHAGIASAAEAFKIATGVLGRLVAGDWKVVREGGSKITALAEAVSRVTGRDVAECISVVNELDKDSKSALRKRKDIKAALAQIAAERAEKAAQNAAEGDEGDLGQLFG